MKKCIMLAVIGMCMLSANIYAQNAQKKISELGIEMKEVGWERFTAMSTEVTCGLYKKIIGSLPICCWNFEDDMPVYDIEWYEAIIFCNKLSEYCGLKPVYKIGKKTSLENELLPGIQLIPYPEDVEKIEVDEYANGFRLPTEKEWETLAGNYGYSGTTNAKKAGWTSQNSDRKPHPVASSGYANEYGIYDTTGNVSEWVFDKYSGLKHHRIIKGGSYEDEPKPVTWKTNAYEVNNMLHRTGIRCVMEK